jgi:hypothetical protein
VISDCDVDVVVTAAGAPVGRAWDDVEGDEEDWVSAEILEDKVVDEDDDVTDNDEEEEEEEVPKPPIL